MGITDKELKKLIKECGNCATGYCESALKEDADIDGCARLADKFDCLSVCLSELLKSRIFVRKVASDEPKSIVEIHDLIKEARTL